MVSGNYDNTTADDYTLTVTYNDKTLGTVRVHVVDKEIDTSVDPVVTTKTVYTKVGVQPDFTGVKVLVTYTDDSVGTLTVGNGLVVDGYDLKNAGSYRCTLKGTDGTLYGTLYVVVQIDYSDYEDATTYPEYPADGAVRIDKDTDDAHNNFQESGVTRVELDVAGISTKSAVDVILIMDISNSMSWNDVNQEFSDAYNKDDPNERLNIAKASAVTFVTELMKDNGDDDPTTIDNTLTLLAFAGIDGNYNTHTTAKDNDDVYQIGALGMTSMQDAIKAVGQLKKATTGGTN
jgi:hypothetical protein